MATTLRPRRTVAELPIRLDPAIRDQGERVSAALREAILAGLVASGARLPSSRALAEVLGVRRNGVVAAYERLMSDGLIEARHGSGTFVAAQLPSPGPSLTPLDQYAPEFPAPRPFALGNTLTDAALLRRLANAVRRRIVAATPEQLGYGDPRGSAHLRAEIARHLAAQRGVRCDPGAILVVNGTQSGLRLCIEALLEPGDAVWMEDPGYGASRRTLEATGRIAVPVPVDAEGLDVAAGRRLGPAARAAYVTPSHQFPSGVSLTMARRVALLEWAESAGAYVIEDDYDSEFRYAGPPLTALAGLGSSRVIYLGTFTKTLFAALRLAYVVLPPALVARVVAVRATHDRFPPRFMQDAVADLIADGLLAAHVRRMRPRYREARDVVAATLREASAGALEVGRPAQGLHLVAMLPAGLPREAGVQIRTAAGIEARLLSETRFDQRGLDGFVLGFSGYDRASLVEAAHRLGRAARSYVSRPRRFAMMTEHRQ